MMKNIFIFLLFISIKSSSIAQSPYSFANDKNYEPHKPELIKLLKKRINQQHDFQLRFWFHNTNNSIIFKDYLLIMEYSQDVGWTSQNFTFIHKYSSKIKVEEKVVGVLNGDSIMKQLTKDSLFYLNSYSAYDVLEEGLKRGLGLHYISEGGTDYTVEMLSFTNKRSFTVNCPASSYAFLKQPLLKNLLAVISTLLQILHIKEPC